LELEAFLESLKKDPSFINHVTYWGVRDKIEATHSPIPYDIHPAIKKYLDNAGIKKLYTHQAETYAR